MIRPLLAAALLVAAPPARGEKPVTAFPPADDPSAWSALLGKHVDGNGRVDYARWKADAGDRARLSRDLGGLSRPGGPPGDREKIAILINAYNAFIIETVLDHEPVEGIRSIPAAFTSETHRFGGESYSLDEIEHTAVRLGGYPVHAAMVCASKSCPPLDRRAFRAEDLSEHEDERMRAWMARADLYQFDPDHNVARLPRYYDWYRADFEAAGIPAVLSRFAPPRYREWLRAGKFRMEYLPYDWRLNGRD